jgi:hypothetical protein
MSALFGMVAPVDVRKQDAVYTKGANYPKNKGLQQCVEVFF